MIMLPKFAKNFVPTKKSSQREKKPSSQTLIPAKKEVEDFVFSSLALRALRSEDSRHDEWLAQLAPSLFR